MAEDNREFVEQRVSERELQAINDRITRQLETQERERAETTEHLKELIARSTGVDLREHFEAVLEESKRALEMAEREREKAAVALREVTEKAADALREQTQKAMDKADSEREKSAQVLRSESQRALDKADVEREKSAQVLREDLARAIEQGDRNLLNHIRQEIERLREALASGEKLELSRIKEIENLARSVQRELTLVQAAYKEAVEKSETSYDKRFESVNELRAQMNDLILSHQAALATLTEKLMLREVADAQFQEIRQKVEDARADREAKLPREVFDRTLADWTIWRETINKRLAEGHGKEQGTSENKASSATETQLALMKGGLALSLLAILVTIVLAANGVF